VQTITESKCDRRLALLSYISLSVAVMNVIRMIKLFGWESKMNERLADRREEELMWLWKQNLLEVANGLIKFVVHVSGQPYC
jgi:hypothetical protein